MNEHFLGREFRLSGSDLTGLMQAVLNKSAEFRFTARGFSMSPFIRDRDVITLSPVHASRLEVGDIVGALNPISGLVIVHRIVSKDGCGFILKGDNCRSPDGFFETNRIAALITSVKRNGKPTWFGGGPEKRIIAAISRPGLGCVVLALLRATKHGFFVNDVVNMINNPIRKQP